MQNNIGDGASGYDGVMATRLAAVLGDQLCMAAVGPVLNIIGYDGTSGAQVLGFIWWSALLVWGCWGTDGGGRAVAMVASVEGLP